ncbi:MAG: hypothetical protein E4H19_12905 [Chromatiales bacterium]|jgi:hypothetical protein|nr:MAG: hypothetical protein E4H19_12905 [Chromatiales bacterium]
MGQRINVRTAVSILLLAGLLPLQVQAACKEKIAELDQRIAGPEVDSNMRPAMKMFRDGAASACDQGNDAAAMQQLGMLEMMLPPPQAEVQAKQQADADTLKPLTDEFMVGRWCSMTGEERAELDFSADGTYTPCFPDSMAQDYVCLSSRDQEPTAEWVASHPSAYSIEQDTVVFGDDRGRPGMTYMRGRCSQLRR